MGAINERLFKLLETDSKNQKELALYLGIDESTISSWKRRGTDPPSDVILKISEYFEVPVRYLVEGNLQISDFVDMRYSIKRLGKNDRLSQKEIQLCLTYRTLSRQHKAMIDAILAIASDVQYIDPNQE